VTKTERWYAIVEELRAVSPRPRSAQWLADRFEVSRRTVERDLDGLLQAGVPMYAQAGRTGGYVLDRTATFTPPALDAAEVTALAVAVDRLAGTPFAEDGRAALRKLVGTLRECPRPPVVLVAEDTDEVPRSVQRAMRDRRVLRLDYADAQGAVTSRDVEPLGFLGGEHWYLIGWCRLRDGVRGFRMDRISAVDVLPGRAPDRDVDLSATTSGPVRSLEI
jgi:predicted DNA-binding transcriptional regulator YafY